LPLPENHFAIPFYYYWQHMKQNKLDLLVTNMLNDSKFRSDINYRKTKLAELQSAIKKASLNPALVEMVRTRLSNSDGFTTFRFRSSTNAEDVEGFNGAGLYESYTGSLTDPEKPIDKAIKKVWASLWDFAAFEERDYFKIDHKTIAMGVLVHRSYPAEAANGVAITENIFNPFMPAVTINVQVGEISVVNPEEKYLPDQILYYTRSDADIYEYINHSNVPGMEGKTVMTSAELKKLKDYCMAIHNHYCFINLECNPMDIEFKVDVVNGERKLYIKQARLY
jgi:phosphoenolpyruvate synthase/pyruvate phosphate dikinase